MTAAEINATCIQILRDQGIGSGKYVVVIGAGLSSPHVCGSDGIKKKLQDYCGPHPNPEAESWELYEAAYMRSQEGYFRAIRESFQNPPNWLALAYAHLVHISFKSYITLNYDNQLQCALNIVDRGFEDNFWVYPTQPAGKDYGSITPPDFSSRRCLVALHGNKSPDEDWPKYIILRKGDYDRHYQGAGANSSFTLHHWWKDLLTRWPCIFVGTSLREPGIESVYANLLKDGNKEVMDLGHIHLVEHPDSSKEQPRPYKSLSNLRRLTYHKKDQQYTGLLDVLGHFSGYRVEGFTPKVPRLELISPEEESITGKDISGT